MLQHKKDKKKSFAEVRHGRTLPDGYIESLRRDGWIKMACAVGGSAPYRNPRTCLFLLPLDDIPESTQVLRRCRRLSL